MWAELWGGMSEIGPLGETGKDMGGREMDF
jgi:hypothetical protein